MRESYRENLANHFGLELYADDGNVIVVATTEGYAGKLLSSVPQPYGVPTPSVLRDGKMFHCDIGKRWNGSAESKNLSMYGTSTPGPQLCEAFFPAVANNCYFRRDDPEQKA